MGFHNAHTVRPPSIPLDWVRLGVPFEEDPTVYSGYYYGTITQDFKLGLQASTHCKELWVLGYTPVAIMLAVKANPLAIARALHEYDFNLDYSKLVREMELQSHGCTAGATEPFYYPLYRKE